MSGVPTVDVSTYSVLGCCPACGYRILTSNELDVRRFLLRHANTEHGKEGQSLREAMRRWLERREAR